MMTDYKKENEIRKYKRQITKKIKKDKDDIDLEILNISSFRCIYKNKVNDYIYFDLQPGESATISLNELYEVAHKTKGFFADHYIVVTDVYTDDYSLEDILVYLNISDIYENILDKDENYIEDLVYSYDIDEFKRELDKDEKLCKAVAQEMLIAYNHDNYYNREKLSYIYNKLGIKDLFTE